MINNVQICVYGMKRIIAELYSASKQTKSLNRDEIESFVLCFSLQNYLKTEILILKL